MEEDDMDFTPSPNTSSNLASLFGFTKKPLQGNSSLTYTAPKAPKRESSPAKKQPEEKSKSKILFSKAVQAYKLENRTYVNQGLIGIVISGNHEARIYEIILYKSTKEHLCQIRISMSFVITLSHNNYVSFYDNNQQNWSIMLHSASNVEQFAQKIAICKFYSQPQPTADILTQDLSFSSQQKTSSNSVVNIVYSSFTLIPEELSKLKGDIKEKIKLSDCEFTQLSKGLNGCAENCKRVIIIPHSQSGPWLNELGPNKDLLIEVKIEKIINDVDVSLTESKASSEGPPDSPIDSSAEEGSIKTKASVASTKSQKANLISRMARMGQATLPVKQGLSGGPSDSEEDVSNNLSPKPRLPRSRNTTANSMAAPNPGALQQMSVYQSDMAWQQGQLGKLGVAYQQLIPVSASPISSPTTDPNLSVYISESRIQATELRMGISKVSEKLDQVWEKIQNLSGVETKTPSQTLIDSGGILSGIQNLITENEKLKDKVEEQKTKIEQQNDRIFHLLELNHKYLERDSTTHDKQSETKTKLQTKMEVLQKKQSEIEEQNKEFVDKIKNSEEELNKSEEVNKQLKIRVEELQTEVEILKKSLEEKTDGKAKELEVYKDKMIKASETITKLKERLREVMAQNETLKSVITFQKKEIESGNQEMENSKTKNEEQEKTVLSLKKQISEEESKMEDLTKTVAKLEEENKTLVEKVQKEEGSKDVRDVLEKVAEVLKQHFQGGKEYSRENIVAVIEKTFRNAMDGSFVYEEVIKVEPTKDVPSAPKENAEVVKKEEIVVIKQAGNVKEGVKEKQSSVEEKEKQKESPVLQKKKNEADSRYKSYDQGWRTTKPPPPPLFDDDDDDDDWLN